MAYDSETQRKDGGNKELIQIVPAVLVQRKPELFPDERGRPGFKVRMRKRKPANVRKHIAKPKPERGYPD